MTASRKSPARGAKPASPGAAAEGALEALAEAVEAGAGVPAVARAAAQALGASLAVIDRSSAVLAIAGASPAEERKLLAAGPGTEVVALRVAERVVGELRLRPGSGEPPGPLAHVVAALLALEVERSRAPEWASDEAAARFVRAVLAREVTDRGDIVARASEMGADLEAGGGVVLARAAPHSPQEGEWRERLLTVALRALRSACPGTLAAASDGDRAEITAIVPAADEPALARAAERLERELAASLPGLNMTIAHSRHARDPADLYRAGREALLALNVAEAEGERMLAFDETGSYRLLLPAMSEDPDELERFYAETVAPVAAYDEQYETDLVRTVETYLDCDGNVGLTAERLYTHRHTVRYRLERVRELSGHDISSSEGREKLSLGLKAMRVLGIAPPRGPAAEPGTEAGRVRRPRAED